jgi:hypothetical protein
MANNQTKSPSSATTESDRAALVALRVLTDYAPSNPAIGIESLNALEARLRQAEEAELLASKALAAARDARVAASWELHNAMLSAKAAVIGQYGHNSNAVQAIGLKKKSDYRRRVRRTVTA